MVQQRVHQRTIRVSGRGVDHHPGGLVDDDQVLVLEQDIERQVLRHQLDRHSGRHAHHHLTVVGPDAMRRRLDHSIIDAHRPLHNQRLDPRSADVREVLGEQVIEALAPLFLGHAQRQFLAIVKVFHGLDIFHVASLGSLAYR